MLEGLTLQRGVTHDFRKTAVRNLERAGVPRSAAIHMVGHKTESIYRRIAIVDEVMLREGAEKLAQWQGGKVGGKVSPSEKDSVPTCLEDSACDIKSLDNTWAVSSAGRALSSHGRGHWFDPSTAHHFFNKLQALIALKKASVDKCR